MLSAILLGGAACSGAQSVKEGSARLEFQLRTENLEVVRRPLSTRTPDEAEICSSLAGELRFGRVPFRLPGEDAVSSRNFVRFAASYSDAPLPEVLVDFDRNGAVDCSEKLPLLAHPTRPGLAFRTLDLGASDKQPGRRYRLSLPVKVSGRATEDVFTLELVDVPVAQWRHEGRETLWILYDGNFDGVFDGRFGDALVADLSGDRRVSLGPGREGFFSLRLPVIVPWGVYEIEELDRRGRWLTLRELPQETADRIRTLRPGEIGETIECPVPGGQPLRIGGATTGHVLLYFWFSHCGACQLDMEALAPLLAQLPEESLQAVGVSLDDDPTGFEAFAREHGRGWEHCYAGAAFWDNPVAVRFGVFSPGGFALLDPMGRLVAQGVRAEAILEELAKHVPEAAGLILDGEEPR